jgi:cell surface protein SprA
LTAAVKINRGDNYSLEPSNGRITNTATSDFSNCASYTKNGFKIPFWISFDNNFTLSFSYTVTKNEPIVYNYSPLLGLWEQNAQTGATTTTTINPSVQYNLSKSVVLQLFYKYNKIEPTGGVWVSLQEEAEAGLNIKLQIQ